MPDIQKGKYWDRPWQLTSGCSPCSPGCVHCWSAAAAHMRQFQKNPKISGQYEGLTYLRDGVPTFNGIVMIHPERLALPNRTKKPTVWSVWNDLFRVEVPVNFLEEALAVMTQCPQHIFLVLTKRAQRLNLMTKDRLRISRTDTWPIKNLWLGVTICTQPEADEKLPIFLQIPGNKYLSLEPMLENIIFKSEWIGCGGVTKCDELKGGGGPNSRNEKTWCNPPCPPRINAIIVGPETGPHRRTCDINWIRNIKDQCQAAGVPLFIKALNLNGKISTDMTEWPADLRVRQLPWG